MKKTSCYLATVSLEAFCFAPVSTASIEEAEKEILEKGLPEGCEWVVHKYVINVDEIQEQNSAEKALRELIENLRGQFPEQNEAELHALAAKRIESLCQPHPGSELLSAIFREGSPNF